MKRKNQLLALLLALCLAVSVLAAPAAAENEPDSSDASQSGEQTGGEDSSETGDQDGEKPEEKPDEQPEEKPGGDQTDGKPDGDQTGGTQKPDEDDEEQKRQEEEEKKKQEEEEKKKQEEEEKKKQEEEEQKKQEEAKKTIKLSFSTNSVNLGKIDRGETSKSVLSEQVTITNDSARTLTLNSSSTVDFSLTGLPGSLAAGKSCTVTVALDSAGSARTYTGKFTITAAFEDSESGVEPRSYSLSVSAEVVAPGDSLVISSSSKDFGKLRVNYEDKDTKAIMTTITITNKGSDLVQMNNPKGNDHFNVRLASDSTEWISVNKSIQYTITPKPSLAIGTYTDTITFQAKSGGSVTFKATVVVEKSQNPITIDPVSVDFGTVEEGYAQPAFKTVTVKNNTEKAVRLESPYSASYEFGTLSSSSIPAGGTATFNIRPRAGLRQNSYNGVVIVQAGEDAAQLEVRFVVNKASTPAPAFSDVPAGSTFAADIAYVSQQGLMSGKGSGVFKPQDPVTRGQLVTMLYRLEGQPAASGSGFSDVAAGSYCENAVKWAAASGITNGGKDGTFKPNDPITREQMATFLYRYNVHKNYSTQSKADLSKFSDAASVSSYAKDALAWANGASLVNGTSDGRLNPSGGATRGQAAAILHRFCVSIGK